MWGGQRSKWGLEQGVPDMGVEGVHTHFGLGSGDCLVKSFAEKFSHFGLLSCFHLLIRSWKFYI